MNIALAILTWSAIIAGILIVAVLGLWLVRTALNLIDDIFN